MGLLGLYIKNAYCIPVEMGEKVAYFMRKIVTRVTLNEGQEMRDPVFLIETKREKKVMIREPEGWREMGVGEIINVLR